jgi:short-subunit dehydrogenase
MQIAGSTILVTGASSGIGAALAPMLAERGATVGIVARRRDRLEAVLAACRRHAPASRLWAADLGDLALAERVALEAWDAFGRLDVLVNNAAIPKRMPVPRLAPADIAHVMDVNFHSPVRMGQAVLPRMLARRKGAIVNVASLGGRVGIVHEAAYCAAKFALCGWSEVMAMDLADTGVEVKLILPGPIATEIWETKPGNVPALYAGPFVSAEECAACIADAIESPRFEHYAPESVPGGMRQHDIVMGKTQDPDTFLTMMRQMATSGSGSA